MSYRKFWFFSIVVTAALSSAAVVFAQGINRLYIVNLAKTFEDPTPAPQPTATPGPAGSCGTFLNATGLTGPFSLTYTGTGHHTFTYSSSSEDLTASVNRSFSGTLTFGNRTVQDDGNGHIAYVEWFVTAINQPSITISDAWTSIMSGPPPVTYHTQATGGTLNSTYTDGSLLLDAATCAYTLTLWPWADQSVGGTATVDNVFRFTADFVPVRTATALAETIQAPVYHNAQGPGTDRPSYEVNVASSNTVSGNPVSGQLYRAQSGLSGAGLLNETAAVNWSLAPIP